MTQLAESARMSWPILDDGAGAGPRVGEVWRHALPNTAFAAAAWWSGTPSMPRQTLGDHLTLLLADACEASGVTQLVPPKG